MNVDSIQFIIWYNCILIDCGLLKKLVSYYCENLDIRDTIEARLDERDPASLIKN